MSDRNRNKVSHIHEVVTQLAHWWDDVVFEQYPTWEQFKAAKFSGLKADDCFGGDEDIGGRNYAQCVKYGIGREVLAKMLEGTETRAAIEEALRNLPMTARRKRGIEQQIEAALEVFGPDHEVALNVGAYQGEWSLQRDLHMENSVNRNKVAHTHEVVYNLVHWFDDKIFRLYPTFESCVGAGIFPRPRLEEFFGKAREGENGNLVGGPGNYTQCVQRGVGRRVVSKMLAGAESDGDIHKAMDNFPMTERHLSKYRDCRRGPRRGLCRCDPPAPADAHVTYKPNF